VKFIITVAEEAIRVNWSREGTPRQAHKYS